MDLITTYLKTKENEFNSFGKNTEKYRSFSVVLRKTWVKIDPQTTKKQTNEDRKYMIDNPQIVLKTLQKKFMETNVINLNVFFNMKNLQIISWHEIKLEKVLGT